MLTGGHSIGVALGQQEGQLAGCGLETSWEGVEGEKGFEIDNLKAEERKRLLFPKESSLRLPANVAAVGVVLSAAQLGCGPESSGKASQRG